MSKSEENDLFIFIESLKQSDHKGFRRHLQSSTKKNYLIQLELFNAIIEVKDFNKEKILKKTSLSEKKYSAIKFELFQELLNYLKTNYDEHSDISLHNKIIEFELLLNSGLFIKANKRLKKIKEIAFEKCDFNSCCLVQRKSIEYRLFKHTNPPGNLKEESKALKEYQALSDNLNTFSLLADEVLNAHYEFMDRRVENSDAILEYLKHPLLQDINNAHSVLAGYNFYRTRSIVYLGNNNYQEGKNYSLKAYNYLKEHPSKYRNDHFRYLQCLNNYLNASLHLSQTESFELMYPQLLDIASLISSNKTDIYSDAKVFQILCTLKLNYLWAKRDTKSFLKEKNTFEESYRKYESILRPNFKLEIILGMAKMYYLSGDLISANAYCKKIDYEKNNPTSLSISCVNLLRIMINFDLENYQLLPHLISTSKYTLKKRSRLFELERLFLSGLHKIKIYFTQKERQKMFEDLYKEMYVLLENSKEDIIDKEIGLLEWIKAKSTMS